MKVSTLDFGEWLPDLPEHMNPGALKAKNCIPEIRSYRSMRGLQAFTNAINLPCLGSVWAKSSGDTLFNFAGDSNSLYSLSGGTTWVDVSTGSYSADSWEFSQFGNRIIATNVANTPQYFDMGVSTNFQNLPGGAPNAVHIAVVRDFIVLGDVDDGTRRPNRVQWSGFNNSEQWGSSAVTQAGSQDLKGRGGKIQRIIDGDVGVIFQERSITRMTYVGPPIKFRFDEVERARGTPAPKSVVWTGAKAYYYANDGFYVLDLYGGADSQPIGSNRVNKWFQDNAAKSEIRNMVGAIDFENNLVLWAFKSSSSSIQNDRLLIYNWQANRWSYVEVDIQTFAEFASPGLTLDELDAVLPNGIDIDSINVDSTAFSGSSIGLLAFNSLNMGSTFSGDVLDFEIDTKEYSQAGFFSFVSDVRPLIDGQGPFSITPIYRNRLVDNYILGNSAVINSVGLCNLRINARYHRFRLTGSVAFNHAIGIEFYTKQTGRR